MADSFARVLDVVMPIQFDRYFSRSIGIPRLYALDQDGLLVGTNSTTYGFDFAGNYSGSRPRSAAEAQWGNTGTNSPRAVGRLWDGKTLWQMDYRNVIGAVPSLAVGGALPGVNVALPVAVGRQFLTCTISSDGLHLLFISAPAGSDFGSRTGDQWHLCRWSGAAFVAVSAGTLEVVENEYFFGPGSSAQQVYRAGMLESDLTNLWVVDASFAVLKMYRIGADGVLRVVNTFSPATGDAPLISTDAFPAIFANKGLCAVVGFSRLTIFRRVALATGTSKGSVPTPFDGYSLRLVQIDNGRFDLAFYDPATNDGADVETLVYAVLFTDSEAPVKREPDRYLRRGWWADAEAGSGLWHVRRQPLGSAARREAIEMVQSALEAHGITGVDVQEATGFAAGVSCLVLKITGFYAGRQFVLDVPL